jgi:hypothetical protein
MTRHAGPNGRRIAGVRAVLRGTVTGEVIAS